MHCQCIGIATIKKTFEKVFVFSPNLNTKSHHRPVALALSLRLALMQPARPVSMIHCSGTAALQ